MKPPSASVSGGSSTMARSISSHEVSRFAARIMRVSVAVKCAGDHLWLMHRRRTSHGAQARRQRDQIARRGDALQHAIEQPLEIANLRSASAKPRPQQRVRHRPRDGLLARASVQIEQRLAEPAAQQPAAHRRTRGIEHPEQRAFHGAAAPAFEHFQVAPRVRVEHHEPLVL